ncbi:trypsin-like serine protease [Rhodovulum kholense]|uniref:Trypsin n=1 Tax=Rhodovulum kholense TaxID=453584 RepID=A0A8E2VHA5_9RHOB|nr:trypsin-like serine protease [Rhodovulum kholense]PTW45285.1 trypsin [Rhodovulum kholense]
MPVPASRSVGLFVVVFSSGAALAQDNCRDTAEGRICSVQQPITSGTPVDPTTQHRLGLIRVNNGCSGRLLNRNWGLTARHCVTTDGRVSGPLMAPDQVSVSAAWASRRTW